MEKSRESFIKNIVTGNIVAFKSEKGMFSGKIVEISDDTFTIETKNKSIFYVESENIVWVKNGTHWPEGIYNALKKRS